MTEHILTEDIRIFLVGPMGVGKTTIGKALAKQLSLDFYDVDQEIEARAGADLSWIYDMEGEDGFNRRERKVIDELSKRGGIVLATGGGAVLDAENRTCLTTRGYVVYLTADYEQLLKRTEHDKKRPLLQTEKREEAMKSSLDERLPFYEEVADLVIHTDEDSIKNVVYNIIKAIQQKHNG